LAQRRSPAQNDACPPIESAPMTDHPLEGRTIAVAESRELDVFVAMLERRGARVLRCPLVGILDAPEPAPVLEWIGWFNSGACDDFVVLTGEGLRRLLSCVDHHAPALRADFLAQLARVRKITRGPKPARALRELGLKPDIAAKEPTTAGIIKALRALDLHGRAAGVQLYGTEPNLLLTRFLEQAGASVKTVAPYIYADATHDAEVIDLIVRIAAGEVDAIAFTSRGQVERLLGVAEAAGQTDALKAALARICVAAVGPVVGEALTTQGVRVDLMPLESYFLKPLTSRLAEALGPASK
jgi:uroporphyrinogen-III synthase